MGYSVDLGTVDQLGVVMAEERSGMYWERVDKKRKS